MAMTLLVLALLQTVPVAISQVTPRYQYQDGKIVPVNGSVVNGRCISTVTVVNGIITCIDPTTSVLFDGNVPTLTGLDSDMWASQLLTLQTTTDNSVPLVFDFTAIPDYSGVEEVEVVMFNCPQWRISADFISVFAGTFSSTNIPPQIATISPTNTSCDYLVRVCISVSATQQAFRFEFSSRMFPFWVHLAEMKFYSNPARCTPDIITPPTTPPPATSVSATTSPTTPTIISTMTPVTTSAVPSSMCPSWFSIAVLSSVLTAIITALLATLIFVLVQIALCKCHPKFRCGGAETVASAGGEGQEYEEVDIDKGGADEGGSGPTYMEVRGGGNTFALKENEAYGTHT